VDYFQQVTARLIRTIFAQGVVGRRGVAPLNILEIKGLLEETPIRVRIADKTGLRRDSKQVLSGVRCVSFCYTQHFAIPGEELSSLKTRGLSPIFLGWRVAL
jgi:hypothetical protein